MKYIFGLLAVGLICVALTFSGCTHTVPPREVPVLTKADVVEVYVVEVTERRELVTKYVITLDISDATFIDLAVKDEKEAMLTTTVRIHSYISKEVYESIKANPTQKIPVLFTGSSHSSLKVYIPKDFSKLRLDEEIDVK